MGDLGFGYSLHPDSYGMAGKVKAFSKKHNAVYVDFGEQQYAKGLKIGDPVFMKLRFIDNVKPQLCKLSDMKVRASFICTNDYYYNENGTRVQYKKGDLVNAVEASPGAHWIREEVRDTHHWSKCKNHGSPKRQEGCTDACNEFALCLHTADFAKFSSKAWQDTLPAHMCNGPGRGEEGVKKTFKAVVDKLEDNGYTGIMPLSSGGSKTVFTVVKGGVKYVARVTTGNNASYHLAEIEFTDFQTHPKLRGIVLPTIEYFKFNISPHELLVIIEIQELVKCCNDFAPAEVNPKIQKLEKRMRTAGYGHTDMEFSDGGYWNNTGITRNGDCVYIDLGGFYFRGRRRLTTEDELGLNGASRKVVTELRRLAKKYKKPNATPTTNAHSGRRLAKPSKDCNGSGRNLI